MKANESGAIKNKVALIISGNQELTKSIALKLSKQGVITGILNETLDKAQAIAAIVKSHGRDAFALKAWVLDKEELEAARDFIMEEYGQLDILINAAETEISERIKTDDNQADLDLQELVVLHSIGVLLPAEIFSGIFARQNYGHIINIASISLASPLYQIAGHKGYHQAVEVFTEWMSDDLSAKHGEGLRVNTIVQVFVVSELMEKIAKNASGTDDLQDGQAPQFTPERPFGVAKDLDLTLYLLCENSRTSTGEVLHVFG